MTHFRSEYSRAYNHLCYADICVELVRCLQLNGSELIANKLVFCFALFCLKDFFVLKGKGFQGQRNVKEFIFSLGGSGVFVVFRRGRNTLFRNSA